jgi:hypothetical protein
MRLGGHFTGGQLLHWTGGCAILSGDIRHRGRGPMVGELHVLVPEHHLAAGVDDPPHAEKLEPYEFDRIYGGWWGRVVDEDGENAVRRSAERYFVAFES